MSAKANYHRLTEERKKALLLLMQWYITDLYLERIPKISKSDYEFIYELWDSGLGIYTNEMQERLNGIRDIYNKDIENEGKRKMDGKVDGDRKETGRSKFNKLFNP